jgi:hypothetical protein
MLFMGAGPAGAGALHPLNDGALPGLIFAYDCSDKKYLFQDTAGTNPVTATGQDVKRIESVNNTGYDLQWQGGTPVPTYEEASGVGYVQFIRAGRTGDMRMLVDFATVDGDLSIGDPYIFLYLRHEEKGAGNPGIFCFTDGNQAEAGEWLSFKGRNDSGLNIQMDSGLSWSDSNTMGNFNTGENLIELCFGVNDGNDGDWYENQTQVENDTSVTTSAIDWGGLQFGGRPNTNQNLCKFRLYQFGLIADQGGIDSGDAALGPLYTFLNDLHGTSYS